ncbi:MAG: helix-turn-helix domain-containing protein [Sphingomonadales bacterium]|jgi:AraC family transcriptional regulator
MAASSASPRIDLAAGIDLRDDQARSRLFANRALAASSAGRRWGAIQADLETQPFLDVNKVFHRHHVVSLALSAGANERWLDGEHRQEQLADGLVAVVPAGVALSTMTGTPVHYMNVMLDPDFLAELPDRHGPAPQLRATFVDQVDPVLSGLMREVQAALLADGGLADLRAEALGLAIARHLLRHHSDIGDSGIRWNYGLTRAQLRKVEEHVLACHGDSLSVQALADLLGLSVPHFSRQFRQATGLSPYQYVLRIRLDQARRAVLRTRLPLVAIAADHGFASEAHLANAFRQHFGYTPGSLRNGRLPGIA